MTPGILVGNLQATNKSLTETFLDGGPVFSPLIFLGPFLDSPAQNFLQTVMSGQADIMGIGVHDPASFIQNNKAGVGGFDQGPVLEFRFLQGFGCLLQRLHFVGHPINKGAR